MRRGPAEMTGILLFIYFLAVERVKNSDGRMRKRSKVPDYHFLQGGSSGRAPCLQPGTSFDLTKT